MKTKTYYVIHSESEDKQDSECSGKIFGIWKLIWFLITNGYNKNVYKNRSKLEIIIHKRK